MASSGRRLASGAGADVPLEQVKFEVGDIVLFSRPCGKLGVLGGSICAITKTAFANPWEHLGIVVEKKNKTKETGEGEEEAEEEREGSETSQGELFLLEATVGGIKAYPLLDRIRRSRADEIAVRHLHVARTEEMREAAEELWHELEDRPYNSGLNVLSYNLANMFSSATLHAESKRKLTAVRRLCSTLSHHFTQPLRLADLIGEGEAPDAPVLRQTTADREHHKEHDASVPQVVATHGPMETLLILSRFAALLAQHKEMVHAHVRERAQATAATPPTSPVEASSLCCSELVAAVLQHIGVLDGYPSLEAFVPADFSSSYERSKLFLAEHAWLGAESRILRGTSREPVTSAKALADTAKNGTADALQTDTADADNQSVTHLSTGDFISWHEDLPSHTGTFTVQKGEVRAYLSCHSHVPHPHQVNLLLGTFGPGSTVDAGALMRGAHKALEHHRSAAVGSVSALSTTEARQKDIKKNGSLEHRTEHGDAAMQLMDHFAKEWQEYLLVDAPAAFPEDHRAHAHSQQQQQQQQQKNKTKRHNPTAAAIHEERHGEHIVLRALVPSQLRRDPSVAPLHGTDPAGQTPSAGAIALEQALASVSVNTHMPYIPLISSWTESLPSVPESAWEMRHIAPNTAVATAGTRSDGIYVLTSGRLDVLDADGRVLGELGPGAVVGWFGSMFDLVGSHSVVTASAGECTLAYLPKTRLSDEIQRVLLPLWATIEPAHASPNAVLGPVSSRTISATSEQVLSQVDRLFDLHAAATVSKEWSTFYRRHVEDILASIFGDSDAQIPLPALVEVCNMLAAFGAAEPFPHAHRLTARSSPRALLMEQLLAVRSAFRNNPKTAPLALWFPQLGPNWTLHMNPAFLPTRESLLPALAGMGSRRNDAGTDGHSANSLRRSTGAADVEAAKFVEMIGLHVPGVVAHVARAASHVLESPASLLGPDTVRPVGRPRSVIHQPREPMPLVPSMMMMWPAGAPQPSIPSSTATATSTNHFVLCAGGVVCLTAALMRRNARPLVARLLT